MYQLNKKISLNIAGAFTYQNELILFLIKNKINKKFKLTVFDGVNNCSWNGGRINRNIFIEKINIEKYNNLNISVAFTFSNHYIDLKDKKGLQLLKWLDLSQNIYKIKNEIILINEEFRKYLKDNYDFILKFSITGHNLKAYPEKDLQNQYIDYYKNLEEKYDIIVPKMEHIFQDWFTSNLNLNKYELMTNDTCRPDCPYYYDHFKEISRMNQIFSKEKVAYDFNPKLSHAIEECWLPNFDPNKPLTSCKTGMDLDQNLIQKSIKLGFNKFKISGRENTFKELKNDIQQFTNIFKNY